MSDFSKLVWLKRTDRHRFTGAELRVLLSIFNHSGSDGRKSHPGIRRMMDETGYGKAAVSTAVSSLKARGWISETYRGSGVSGNASVFELVPDAPSSSPVGEQPNDGSSSSGDKQLSGSSSPSAGGCSPVGDRVVRLEANPSDPLSDPLRSDPLGGREDRPSDPVQVRYPPNHVFDPFEVSDFEGSAGKNKTAELSIGRPDGEGLPLDENDHQCESEPKCDNPLHNLDSVIPKAGVTDSGDPRDPFSSAFVPTGLIANRGG